MGKGNYIVVRRMMLLGVVMTAFFLVDGFVLFLTNGLTSDAGPVFPWLGGSFNSNRSSGTGLMIIGGISLAVVVVGWLTYGRSVRSEYFSSLSKPASGTHIRQKENSQKAATAQQES